MEVAESEQEQLGRYRLERTLGAGGMGVVYLARDTRLQRQVAIKKLRKDATSDSAGARIQSEAQLLARLNHPHVVQLYDVLEERDGIALVMEYVEGTTLREWMREHSAPLRDKLGLLMQICKGLSQAHTLGIIHRDLKPDNILITLCGTAKITDFGIAKSQREDAGNITREDHVAGTVEAMSPEQLRGLPLCPRTDLFSLGTIAYELLCGAKPFGTGEGGSLALAHRVVSEPHIPPQQAWADIPEPVAALLDRLLAKNPGQRPESAQQVYEALDFLYQHQTDDTDTREFSDTVTRLLRKPPSRRRRTLHALAGAAGFAAICAAGYFGWEYATRLEPQYIAVLPVEISGEVRGEENAEALTAAMVRQALMNATSQLKASALVSFTPKEEQDFDAQLQALRDKGVTDALLARLECARVRCEIELQRIGPADSRIKQQSSFAFLVDRRQEAAHRITNSSVSLFPKSYSTSSSEHQMMAEEDYSRYLDIISRLESKSVTEDDLNSLLTLSDNYTKNPVIYRTIVDVAARIQVITGETKHIESALRRLEEAQEAGINDTTINELKLFIYSLGEQQEKFELLAAKLTDADFPIAELKNKRARYFYRSGKYDKGLKEAKDAASLSPTADNLYLVALNQIASGNYSDARGTLNVITESFPEHWSSYSALGVIELESGNLAAAETAITSIPENLRGWRTKSNLGVVYFLQKKYTLALKAYQQVLDAVPGSITTTGQMGEALLALGKTDQAKEQFQQLLRITEGKDEFEAKLNRTLALANLGQISEAIPLTLDILSEAPDDTDVKYTAAQVYSLAGEWRSASYHIEKLLEQGMSAEWFNLLTFQQLCTQPQVSTEVKTAICD